MGCARRDWSGQVCAPRALFRCLGVRDIAAAIAAHAHIGLLGVRQIYENYSALTHLDVTMALIALAIAIASGVLAGLYPTWRVCRVQPASYLKTQ